MDPADAADIVDLFLSYAHADRDAALRVAGALSRAGLRVFLDTDRIDNFDGISEAIRSGLSRSKAVLALCTTTYLGRPACQWELTTALLTIGARRPHELSSRVLAFATEASEGQLPLGLRDRQTPDFTALTDEALAALAATISGRVGALAGPIGDLVEASPGQGPRFGVVRQVGREFAGRFPQLWRLDELLWATAAPMTSGLGQSDGPVAIDGMAGIGKSTLLSRYVALFGARYPGGVFRLEAHGADLDAAALEVERIAQLSHIVEQLGGPGDLAPERQLGWIRGRIEAAGKPCLWIVDDAPAERLSAWLLEHPLVKTVLTARTPLPVEPRRRFTLGRLTREEAHTLMKSAAPALVDSADLDGLLGALDGHPLAIELAASALSAPAAPSIAEYRAALDRYDTSTGDAITAAVKTQLEDVGTESLDVLGVAMFAPGRPLPVELIGGAFGRSDDLESPEGLRRAKRAVLLLDAFRLASRPPGQDVAEVHALVTRAFHARGVTRQAAERLLGVREALLMELAKTLDAVVDPRSHRRLAPHVAIARDLSGGVDGELEDVVASLVALHDTGRGWHASAARLWEAIADARSRRLGTHDRQTIEARLRQASSLRESGEFSRAKALATEQLELLGPGAEALTPSAGTPADVALRTLAAEVVANSLAAAGDLTAAVERLRAIASERLAVFGPDHPLSLTALRNLGLHLVTAQRHREGALVLLGAYRRARQTVGDSSPTTLGLLHEVARALHGLGRLRWAEAVLRDYLAKGAAFLDDLNPDLMVAEGNLAEIYFRTDRTALALPLQQKVLERQLKVRDRRHGDVAIAAYSLYRTLDALGRLVEAEQTYDEHLDWLWGAPPEMLSANHQFVKQILGADEVLAALEQLAIMLSSRKDRHPEAVSLLRRLVAIYKGRDGAEAVTTSRVALYLFSLIAGSEDDMCALVASTALWTLDRDPEDLSPEQRRFHAILSTSPEATVANLGAYAVRLQAAGKLDEAASLLETLHQLASSLLGHTHGHTLRVRQLLNLASRKAGHPAHYVEAKPVVPPSS